MLAASLRQAETGVTVAVCKHLRAGYHYPLLLCNITYGVAETHPGTSRNARRPWTGILFDMSDYVDVMG